MRNHCGKGDIHDKDESRDGRSHPTATFVLPSGRSGQAVNRHLLSWRPHLPERTESFSYDAQTGRIASAIKREGAIDYAYDDHGALASMLFLGRTVAYGHDAHGRLSHVQVPDGEWRYEYDSSGRKKSVQNVAAGIVEEWEHDALGRLLRLSHVDVGKPVGDPARTIYEAQCTFGPDGRRVPMVERRSRAAGGSARAGAPVRRRSAGRWGARG